MNKIIFLALSSCLLACAQPSRPQASASVPPAPQAVAKPAPDPASTSEPAPSPVATKVTRPQPKAPPKETTYRLVKGKLSGPGAMVRAKILLKEKNAKGGGFTTHSCWDYGKFSIVQIRSSEELGAGELNVRHPSAGKTDLCQLEFTGHVDNLKLREGFFAGVADGLVVADGADLSEGVSEFQLFAVSNGKEVYRAQKHPQQPLEIARKGEKTALKYHAKVKVRCDLAMEGEPCWQRISEENHLPKTIRKPDCKTDPVLVTAPVHVADIARGKSIFMAGKATCELEP